MCWEAETDLWQTFVVEKVSHLLQEALLASSLPTWDRRLLYNKMTRRRSYWSCTVIQEVWLPKTNILTKTESAAFLQCLRHAPPITLFHRWKLLLVSKRPPKPLPIELLQKLMAVDLCGPCFIIFTSKPQSSLDTNGSQCQQLLLCQLVYSNVDLQISASVRHKWWI